MPTIDPLNRSVILDIASTAIRNVDLSCTAQSTAEIVGQLYRKYHPLIWNETVDYIPTHSTERNENEEETRTSGLLLGGILYEM